MMWRRWRLSDFVPNYLGTLWIVGFPNPMHHGKLAMTIWRLLLLIGNHSMLSCGGTSGANCVLYLAWNVWLLLRYALCFLSTPYFLLLFGGEGSLVHESVVIASVNLRWNACDYCVGIVTDMQFILCLYGWWRRLACSN